MEISDSELVFRYRNGDVTALELLVQRYRGQLFGFILNMTRGKGDPEDVFQDVWFRAIHKFHTYRDDRFLAWLFRIARNLLIDRFRQKKDVLSLNWENEAGVALQDALPDPGRTAHSHVVASDCKKRIADAVDRLPLEQKEVFLMRMEADLSFKEIAELQKVSINTALARMQYALTKLRSELKDEWSGVS